MEKLGIVFYGRAKSLLIALFSIWVLFFVVTTFQQAIGAYLDGGGFDIPIIGFLVITWFLFFPYLLVSAIIFRSITARLSFHRFIKRQIVIPEYSPPAVLSPAESGLLIDNQFHMSEVSATLIDLVVRKYLLIDGSKIRKISNEIESLSAIEREFISDLFDNGESLDINVTTANKILEAGKNLAENTRSKLVAEQQLTPSAGLHKKFRQVFNTLLVVAIIVQTLETIALISDPSQVLSINYPRYPMSIVEPISILVVLLIFLALSISGLWQRAVDNKNGVIKWRYVAGLKTYIDMVYKHKFFDGDNLTVGQKEYATFYPYAVALGLENEFTNQLEELMLT